MNYRRGVYLFLATLVIVAVRPTVGVFAQGAQLLPAVPQQGKAASAPTESQPVPKQPSATELLNVRMQLGDGHTVWHPTRAQLGLSIVGTPVPGGPVSFNFDPSTASAYLTRIAPYAAHAPHHAHIVLPANYPLNELGSLASGVPVPVIVAPASPGYALNVDASVSAIQQIISSDPLTTHIVLAMDPTTPAPSGPNLTGINARIGHFVTHFNPGEVGRTQTVRLAISLIDGRVVAPGALFSVNEAVGERTAARGFGQGIVFVDGHLDTQLGGGMCQVATTLFNAALLANLQIVERFQHVRTVPYVPPGRDATVYWGQKDFKFTNNTHTPILIYYRTTATHAVCDLYGIENPNVKVSLDDNWQRLGPREYAAVLRRYVTVDGHTSVNYTVRSDYKWTPKLDYTF
jgi:hypothetical protein